MKFLPAATFCVLDRRSLQAEDFVCINSSKVHTGGALIRRRQRCNPAYTPAAAAPAAAAAAV
jgi:hypothetical protein